MSKKEILQQIKELGFAMKLLKVDLFIFTISILIKKKLFNNFSFDKLFNYFLQIYK